MPLLKRKKVSQLPVPKTLVSLPPPSARRDFLASGTNGHAVDSGRDHRQEFQGVVIESPNTTTDSDDVGDPKDPDALLDALLPLKAHQAALARDSREDGARPLEVGKWVEPEVYLIARTGEIFGTYE
jgi:hypothetical protein